jgi:hypothetical protein
MTDKEQLLLEESVESTCSADHEFLWNTLRPARNHSDHSSDRFVERGRHDLHSIACFEHLDSIPDVLVFSVVHAQIAPTPSYAPLQVAGMARPF